MRPLRVPRGSVVYLLRLLVVLGGIALAYAAQGVLAGRFHIPVSNEQLPVAGGVGLLAGGILFGLAMPRPKDEAEAIQSRPFSNPTFQLLVAAVAFYLASLAFYMAGGETLAVWLAWALAVLFLLAACWQRPAWSRSLKPSEWVNTVLPLALILLSALALRLWRLDTLPLALVGDTVTDGIQARAILYGDEKGVIGFAWDATPRLGFMLEALTMALFGDNYFGLCMSSVASGMLSLIAVYLLAVELFDRRVGWLATGLTAISYTHIHFSRVPHVIDPVPWVAFSLYFLVHGTRSGRSRDATLAGLTAGVALQMYYAGRSVLVVAGFLALYLLLARRFSLKQWGTAGLGLLIALGPEAIYILQNWDRHWYRSQTVSIFNPDVMAHLRNKYGQVSQTQVVLENAKRAFLTFFYYGNSWGERNLGRPFFGAFTAPLLALGFGYALLRPRRMANWLLVSGSVAIVFLTIALTADPPLWQRMLAVMPLVAILAALALDRITRLVPLPKVLLTLALLALLAGVGWKNWAYFVEHESQRVQPIALAARYAATLPTDRTLLVVNPPWQVVFNEFRFFASQVSKETVSVEDAAAGQWPDLSSPPVVVFTPEHADLIPVLEESWPGGSLRQFELPNGELAFYAYESPP